LISARIEWLGSYEVLNVDINPRVISSGFDIRTPFGAFSAKIPFLAPTGETLVFDQQENQIARIGLEGVTGRVYSIIISGGGYYQFGRDEKAKRTWTCKGEGRLLNISEGNKGQFSISDGKQEIAEAKKAWLTGDYAIKIFNDADFRLVVCVFVALNMRENQGSGAGIGIGG
jgi:hypothetical protein